MRTKLYQFILLSLLIQISLQLSCRDGRIVKNILMECKDSKCDQKCLKCPEYNYGMCQECVEKTYLLDGDCLDYCPEGYFANFEKRECQKQQQLSCRDGRIVKDILLECKDSKCDQRCLKCPEYNYGKCQECVEKTYLLDGDCLDNCPEGYFANFEKRECQKQQQLTCRDGRIVQDINKECVDSKCGQRCLKCYENNYGKCQECDEKTFLLEIDCVDYCPEGYFANIEKKECQKQYCGDKRCLNCNVNSEICVKCKDGNDIIFEGKCVESCPNGYFENRYQNKIQNVCQKCPYQCETCSSSDKCITCAISGASQENNCLCKNGNLEYEQKCVPTCPLGWKANQSIQKCERICQNGLYPEFSNDKKDYVCRPILKDDDDYCLQLVEKIHQMVHFKLSKVNKEDKDITVLSIFNEVPQECFTYKLFGKPQFLIPFQKIQNDSTYELQLSATISKQDFQNPEKVESDDKYSYLYLKIFYQDFLQHTVRAKITLSFDLILSNENQLNADNLIYDPLCESCEVPVEKKVKSSTTTKCPSDSTCENGKIILNTNTKFEITQQIDDLQFQNNTIYPHSIIFKQTQNGKELLLQIRDYKIDNSIVGKITYKFQDILSNSGVLIITSKVINSKSGSRILEQSNSSEVLKSNFWYSTDNFQIEVKENDLDEDYQLGMLNIILICVLSVLLTLILIYVLRKKRQEKLNNSINSLDTSYSHQVELVMNSNMSFHNNKQKK